MAYRKRPCAKIASEQRAEFERRYRANPERYDRQYAALKIGGVALFALVFVVFPLIRVIKTLVLLP